MFANQSKYFAKSFANILQNICFIFVSINLIIFAFYLLTILLDNLLHFRVKWVKHFVLSCSANFADKMFCIHNVLVISGGHPVEQIYLLGVGEELVPSEGFCEAKVRC